MDDLYNKTYSAEQKTGTILNIFSVLIIFVACLGLFGLATYTAEQRTKEIGIRKVLGASVTQVTQMLSKEFLKLVLIASLIAFPVAWWAMNKWLQSFAYRINISWWVFVVAGITRIVYCIDNSKLPGNKSSNCKSCKEFENGMRNLAKPFRVRRKA